MKILHQKSEGRRRRWLESIIAAALNARIAGVIDLFTLNISNFELMDGIRRIGWTRLAVVTVILRALMGCREPAPIERADKAPAAPRAAVELTAQVIGDDELAEGLELLRGEWKARSGGRLSVERMPLEGFADAESLTADVVIFPSRLLGTLAERGELQPVRRTVLESSGLALADIYPAIRDGEMKYGGQTLALPLGSPPLLSYWRDDLGSSVDGEASKDWPPRTWQDYRRWLGVGQPDAKQAALPLAGRTAAYTLLARALAYTEPSRRSEALFDPDTMKPGIAAPPFVRALGEIVEEMAAERDAQPEDFAAAMKRVRDGEAVATLGWPGAASEDGVASTKTVVSPPEFGPLPVAAQVFSHSQGRWQNQSLRDSVTILGAEGRLVGVSARSRNAVSAFRLCQWLTSGDVAVQLSSRSRGTLWYRASQTAAYDRWSKGDSSRQASLPVTEVVAEAFTSDTAVVLPRVPAIDEYFEALAQAVRSAEPGEDGAKAALEAAAATWEAITDRLGRESQAAAYRRHSGIEPFEPM